MQLQAYETPSPASTKRKPGNAYDKQAGYGITECLPPGPNRRRQTAPGADPVSLPAPAW